MIFKTCLWSILLASPVYSMGCNTPNNETSDPSDSDTDADADADADSDADADMDTDTDTDTDSDSDTDPVEFEERISDLDRETAPDATQKEIREMRDGNVTLGFDLFHALAKEKDGNLALSPFSLRGVFGMVLAGAKDRTATEISDVMGFLGEPARTHNALNHFDLALQSRNLPETNDLEPVILETANQMFARLDWQVGDDYLDTIAVNYGAGVFLADFAGDPDGERVKINKWVEDQTYDRIVDLIPAGSIIPDTAWVLVNAVYLKAPWLTKFSDKLTSDETFTRLDGTEIQVSTMHGGRDEELIIPYAEGKGYGMIELPLRGSDLTVTFLLPDPGTYADFEASLSIQSLNAMLSGLKQGVVKVSLPKFKIKTGSMDLKPILMDLGMPTPFGSTADFSGFGPDVTATKISFVYQSAFVAADEAGIEAAAASAVGGTDSAPPPPDFVFNADRPFIFLIRDIPTGLVLFLGRVLDPSA